MINFTCLKVYVLFTIRYIVYEVMCSQTRPSNDLWLGSVCTFLNYGHYLMFFYGRPQNKFRLKVLRTVGILVTISTYNRCSVRLYLQLFVGNIMSYLCYLYLFAHSGVQHILCCVFF